MRTKVFIGTSLDGFIARKNGDIDWLTPFGNEEAVKSYEEFMSGIDAIVIGRGTFEKVLTFPFWPYTKPLFVLSNTMKEIPAALKHKAKLLAMKPNELLLHLTAEGLSSIYIDGGKVIQGFLREGLVDEIIITRIPMLIGNGIPLFGELDNDIRYQHKKTDVYSNGLVRSHYEKGLHAI